MLSFDFQRILRWFRWSLGPPRCEWSRWRSFSLCFAGVLRRPPPNPPYQPLGWSYQYIYIYIHIRAWFLACPDWKRPNVKKVWTAISLRLLWCMQSESACSAKVDDARKVGISWLSYVLKARPHDEATYTTMVSTEAFLSVANPRRFWPTSNFT